MDRFLAAARADLPALTDEIVDALRTTIADYRGLHETWHRDAVRRAVERILLTLVGTDATMDARREIGQSEQRIGRSPDALHAAFWLGARLAWRRWTRLARTCGLSPEQVSRLGDAILAHAEEVAGRAAEGFASAESTGAPASQAQERLANLLLGGSSPAPDVLADAAQAARWPLPDVAAVVALRPADGAPADVSRIRVPADVLPGLNAGPVLIVPGPDAADRAGQWTPEGWLAAVGPSVPVTALRSSWRVAHGGVELVRRGLVERPAPGSALRAADHLEAVVLTQDDEVLGVLVERYLRPLSTLSPRQQERMVDTVLAWLTCGESVPSAAVRLAVHPQTVHYRLRQARALFGTDLLRDPARRLEFTMALRARQLVR